MGGKQVKSGQNRWDYRGILWAEVQHVLKGFKMSLDSLLDFLELAACLNASNDLDTNTKCLFNAQLFGACNLLG